MDDGRAIERAVTSLSAVVSVGQVRVEDGLIQQTSVEHRGLGRITLVRLEVADAEKLFDFYVNGLSMRSRDFFPPYPLFSPMPDGPQELAGVIGRWREERSWTVLLLWREDALIGMCLLKWYDTERPVSGLAVREDYRKRGLGRLLQTVVNEQARLLGLKAVYATMAPENIDSQEVHVRSGFRRTGRTVPHYAYVAGRKVVDRQDVEMILDLQHE